MKHNDFQLAQAYGERRRKELEILEYKHELLNESDLKEIEALRRDFLSELVTGRLIQLKQELSAAKTQEDIINATGSFHYDLISMHPYSNGNGRLSRLLTERILTEHGLPPPVWTEFGEDVAVTKEKFLRHLKSSMAISQVFHEDLNTITEAGLPHGMVAVGFLAPLVSKRLAEQFPIDVQDFMAWVTAGRNYFDRIGWEIAGYDLWKKSPETSHFQLATPLFVGTFGKLSTTAEAYADKMESFYSSQVVHRTHNTKGLLTDRVLLEEFSKMAPGPDPETTFAQFNRTVVRAPPSKLQWARKGVAEKAGMTAYHEDPKQAYLAAGGRGAVTVQVSILARNVGSLKEEGIVFQAAGADPESVVRVRALDRSGNVSTAERTGFNRIEIVDYEWDVRLATRTYELSSDGSWSLVKVGR